MTRATASRYYSQQFFELAEVLSKNPEKSIELEFASPQAAKSFRLEFYSFRGCAEREKLTDVFPELCAIQITIEGNKATIAHKDYTTSALALKAALEKVK